MNIGIDARYLENEMTGIGRYSYNLLANLFELDLDNRYHVFLRSSYRGKVPRHPNAMYHYVPYPPISLRSVFPVGSRRLIRDLDLLHSHFPVAPLFPHPRSVVTVHDLQPLLEPRLAARRSLLLRIGYRVYYPLFYRTTLYRADAVIAVSNATRWYVEAHLGIPRERVHVVYEALDERFRRPDCRVQPGSVANRYLLPHAFLLYVGATLPHKNLIRLLEGYALAVRSGAIPDVHLVLAGRPSRFEGEIKGSIQRLGIGGLVHTIGYVRPEDLPVLYSMALGVLYVTRFEGFGYPPLEALECGTPVVVSAHGALPEVVGPCGIFVDPDDVKGIAKAVREVVTNTGLRSRILSMAKERLGRFDWRRAASQTLRIYQEVHRGRASVSTKANCCSRPPEGPQAGLAMDPGSCAAPDACGTRGGA